MDIRRIAILSVACLGLAACNSRPAEESSDNGGPITGAHQTHLQGPIARPIACGQCHSPTFEVTLEGSLARAKGAVGTYNASAKTCSNVYCHDGGPQLPLGGGTVPTPTWNPPSTVACGGCHASPGGATATPWHPAVAQGVQCGLCHPGYTNTTVNRDLHVNGEASLTNPTMLTNCAACHGDSTRVLPPGTPELAKAAPPVDRNGGTSPSLRGVGAHQRHVNPAAGTGMLPIACNQCHVVPSDLSHVGPLATSPATVYWGTLAAANGANPTLVVASGTVTCSNVYCHGGGPLLPLGGGTLTTPTWNPPSAVTCGSCHALPGGAVDTSAWHPAVAVGADCGLCHTGYTRTSVNPQTHVNGQKDVRAPALATNCTACHGDAGRTVPSGFSEIVKAAPPVDRTGSSDTKRRGVGAHQTHLIPQGSVAISNPIACTECHLLPTPPTLVHVGPGATTPASLDWGPLATANSTTPTFDTTSVTCTNYCHGAKQTGGSLTAPTWTKVDGTQSACGTCHGNPPTSGVHVQHVEWYGVSCGICHPTGYAPGVVGIGVVPIHVNGTINMNVNPIVGNPSFVNWNPNTAGPNGWRGTATGCHGGTRYWTPGNGGSCQ